MATMTYLDGREAIATMLEKYKNEPKRQGIIDQILWCVAKGEGVEFANALIVIYNLEWLSRGSHNRFDCYDTDIHYHSNRHPHLVSCPDDYRSPTKKDNEEIDEEIDEEMKG